MTESDERKLRKLAEDVEYVDDDQFVKDFDKKVDEIQEEDEEEPKEVVAYGAEVDTTPTDDEEEVLSLEEAIRNAKAAI